MAVLTMPSQPDEHGLVLDREAMQLIVTDPNTAFGLTPEAVDYLLTQPDHLVGLTRLIQFGGQMAQMTKTSAQIEATQRAIDGLIGKIAAQDASDREQMRTLDDAGREKLRAQVAEDRKAEVEKLRKLLEERDALLLDRIAKHDGQVAEDYAKRCDADREALRKIISDPEGHLGANHKAVMERFDKFERTYLERATELRTGSYAKGTTYEDALAVRFEVIAAALAGTSEWTGDDLGVTGRSKEGDFVLTIPSAHGDAVVVVQATDAKKHWSPEAIRKDVEKGVRNRNGHAGLWVGRCPEMLAKRTPAFGKVGEGAYYTIYDPATDTGALLAMAVSYALEAAIQRITPEAADAIDMAAVTATLGTIRGVCSRLVEITRKAKTVEGAGESIRTIAEGAQGDLVRALRELRGTLGAAEGEAA